MKIDQHLTEELTRVAHLMADAARDVILPYFRSDTLDADNKLAGGYDPVTVADREAEAAMRAVLMQHRPDDAILGEEMGTQAGTTDLTWVLDPIDGTAPFIAGVPVFGTLISLAAQGQPLIGVMHLPVTQQRWVGVAGRAATRGARLVTRSTCRKHAAAARGGEQTVNHDEGP